MSKHDHNYAGKISHFTDEHWKAVENNQYNRADYYGWRLWLAVWWRCASFKDFFKPRELWNAIVGYPPDSQRVEFVSDGGIVDIKNLSRLRNEELEALAKLEANRTNYPVGIKRDKGVIEWFKPDVIEVRKEHIDEWS